MDNKYPKGSEWRKWDLHVHTPKSIVQNYGGDNQAVWDAFIQKIASLPSEIKVIGITDYLFCDGYEYLLTRREEIPNIELIIPNIEFRLDTFSGTANNMHRHNYHVLFDPSIELQDIREQLLSRLSTGYKIQDNTEWKSAPTYRSLETLGKEIKKAAPPENSIHSKTDLEVGFDNITYKRKDIEECLQSSCFKGKYITAIGYTEWDQSRWNQSAATKRDLINSVNFCLTSLEDPELIERNRKDLKDNNLCSLVFHSSDAHELEKIGQSLLWIKSDPTFAGLKQTLNEPESRVYIGEFPPCLKPEHKIIKSVKIPSSNGWFENNFEIELNSDLVAIVGGRGSGKSALAEAIAYGAGSLDTSEDSFFKKASKHSNPITGTKIQLTWGDNSTTEFEVGKLDAYDRGLVRYLPQGIVEELCSPTKNEALQQQIENVIFQAISDTEKMGASSFEELKNQTFGSFQFEKDQVRDKICQLSRLYWEKTKIIKDLPNKEKILGEKNIELKKLIESLPKLPPEDTKRQDDLAGLFEIKRKIEEKIIGYQKAYSKISETESVVRIFKGKILEFEEQITGLLDSLEISDKKTFYVTINETKITELLEKKKAEIVSNVNLLKKGSKKDIAIAISVSEKELLYENLETLNQGIEQKQKETKSFESIKIKYQQQKTSITNVQNSIKSIEDEIRYIKETVIPEKNAQLGTIIEIYLSCFNLLINEKGKIEELYKPIQNSLSNGNDTDQKLTFKAQINYDIEGHLKTGLDVIDRTRKGNYRDVQELNKALEDLWTKYTNGDFNITICKEAMGNFIKSFLTFEEKSISIEAQLRESHTMEDFLEWIFDTRFFQIGSSLSFSGTDIYLLSPGQKGIILLMLYLKIDKADYRPIIIDQPEENLDNLSVYHDLIGYFREGKKYRQIIMVTHNPNLVVNTDAEQTIVANYDGTKPNRLKYVSGSLEDQAKKIPNIEIEEYEDGIIEQVCKVLEGGESAFLGRKKKYQISNRSQI
ncbi:MAG: AAA family ATPase [Candidatus Shapirobacteria bacterium]